MAIEIVDSPEPLSEAAQHGRVEPLLVESSASRVLRQELQRYCSGQINGRSFLIAGHRGAGKTTLVAKAFMDVKNAGSGGGALLRPLFIPLHGPSLFPDPRTRGEAHETPDAESADPEKTTSKTTSKSSDKTTANTTEQSAETTTETTTETKRDKAARKSDAQIALEQITLGLHRAVSREFADCYRARAQDLAYLRRTPNAALEHLRAARRGQSAQPAGSAAAADAEFNEPLPGEADLQRLIEALPHERELFELAAQFEAELYEAPIPQRLREFWNRMQALSGGVLFRDGYQSSSGYRTASLPPGLSPNLVEVHEQGARELVALSGVLEAYRRISGDYKRTDGGKSTAQETAERTTGVSAATKELVAPIVSLLTGGLTAVGLGLARAPALLTALTGLGTAIGSSLVFKASTTRKREQSHSREYQFIYDLSVSTLDRILPILIERLRAAGLAPVFVVDELDKVRELSERIVSMVHHLKKLVAENAFFCFLTNRSYFEEMLAQGSGRPYPVEYTYYTHRLFVVFSPEDFEQYLRKRLPDPAAPAANAPMAQTPAPQQQHTVEATACAILRWALRHRSQLHVVDLQREIAALRDDNGRVRTSAEVLASARRNLIDVTLQVGIELTLGQRDVQQVLLDRPEFRRVLHDAMYYLSRQWLDGVEEVNLSDEGLEDFRKYLESRTGRDEERPRYLTNGEAPAPEPLDSVSYKDLLFLFDQVRILADFLSDRPSIEVAFATTGSQTRDWRKELLAAWNDDRTRRLLPEVEPDVLDILLVGDRTPVLFHDRQREGVYVFGHQVAGTAVMSRRPSGYIERMPRPGPVPDRAMVVQPPAAAQSPAPTSRSEPAQATAPAALDPIEAAPRDAVPAAWSQQADFIVAFAEALDSATRAKPRETQLPGQVDPPNPVTLDALATRFRIFTPSPTASVVLGAIDNLRNAEGRGTPHAGYADDVFQVGKFHDTLQRTGPMIARALVLGAVVGRASPETGREHEIAAGLDVLARALRFANKREDDVRRSLENVSTMVRTAHGNGIERLLGYLSDQWPSTEAFKGLTRDALDQVAKLTKVDTAAVVDSAWKNVHARLVQWVTNGEVLDPDFTELLAGAARKGPARLLTFDPRDMTLHEWTRALLTARSSVTQPRSGGASPDLSWLTFFAWHCLGFRANGDFHVEQFARWAGVQPVFASDNPPPNEWPELLKLTHRLVRDRVLLVVGRETPSVTLIMLRRTRSPVSADWRPAPGQALLLVTAEELVQLREPLTGDVLSSRYPHLTDSDLRILLNSPNLALPLTPDRVCAVEMEPELATELVRTQIPAIKELSQNPWFVYVYDADRGRDMKLPNVIAPPDTQAVIDAAMRGQTPPVVP